MTPSLRTRESGSGNVPSACNGLATQGARYTPVPPRRIARRATSNLKNLMISKKFLSSTSDAESDTLPPKTGEYRLNLRTTVGQLHPTSNPIQPARVNRDSAPGLARGGGWSIHRKTAKDRFSRSLRRLNKWLRSVRHEPVANLASDSHFSHWRNRNDHISWHALFESVLVVMAPKWSLRKRLAMIGMATEFVIAHASQGGFFGERPRLSAKINRSISLCFDLRMHHRSAKPRRLRGNNPCPGTSRSRDPLAQHCLLPAWRVQCVASQRWWPGLGVGQ